jgi:hypothetical protein
MMSRFNHDFPLFCRKSSLKHSSDIKVKKKCNQSHKSKSVFEGHSPFEAESEGALESPSYLTIEISMRIMRVQDSSTE